MFIRIDVVGAVRSTVGGFCVYEDSRTVTVMATSPKWSAL